MDQIKIWVDGDACPQSIKSILFKTAERREVITTVVANVSIRVPSSEFIKSIAVRDGADVADKRIVELMSAGDIVITADIPLASLVVEQQGIAIGTRGELYDESSVKSRLASRNLGEQLRAAGMETKGPKPHTPKDTQAFANQLDRLLTKQLRKIGKIRKD